jgi:hypothetical protein
MNTIQEALTKYRQEKAMIDKRVAGDQQRLRELAAIITALESVPDVAAQAPAPAAPAPADAPKTNPS